jgi:hypothetical protein
VLPMRDGKVVEDLYILPENHWLRRPMPLL